MFLDYLSFVLIYVRVRSPSPGNLSKQPEAKGSGSTPSRSMRCQGLGVHFSSLLSRTERPPWLCRFKLQVLIMIRVCSAPGSSGFSRSTTRITDRPGLPVTYGAAAAAWMEPASFVEIDWSYHCLSVSSSPFEPRWGIFTLVHLYFAVTLRLLKL